MMPLIRLAQESDAGRIQTIYGPIVSDTVTSFEAEVPTVDEMGRRVMETLPHHPWLVCEHQGEVLGYVYGSKHRARTAYQWSVEVSAYIHAQARRQGLGRALYVSLFKILVLQGFYNAYAGITLPNPGSVGLHEALGFQPVGIFRDVGYKFGAWHAVGWWQLPLQPPTADPAPPLPLDVVIRSPGWDAALAAGLPFLHLSG
jgi:L-amino acid N-acyltransferase YncA